MEFDAIVIGAGISGLTAASLMAKRGLKVCVTEQASQPGGSMGTFKRKDCTFEQGAAMLYGFGKKGFNPHRFVMNCLEESCLLVSHKELYCVWYQGQPIHFYPDINRFIEELAKVFPTQKKNFTRFYKDMFLLYKNIFIETPVYTTPDEIEPKDGMRQFMGHPLSYLKLLRYMNLSIEDVLKKYFNDPLVFSFFNKLTSTYCYTTVKEAPAILGSVMFIDNHYGGSYYIAGGTQYLCGTLEKVVEEHNGSMYYCSEVERILFAGRKACGVRLKNKDKIFSDAIIYTGTVWNLYRHLLPEKFASRDKIRKINVIEPTYPSVVLYLKVREEVIPKDTQPIEMLAPNASGIDESEITIYIFSLIDSTLCDKGYHVMEAIGPSFLNWNCGKKEYQHRKKREIYRMLGQISKRFPNILDGVIYAELATPKTIERYTMKNNGAVAGPKQRLGQHMLHRLHTQSPWPGLYYAGESTVMGTGTPSVTTSGIAAANAVLKQYGKKTYTYEKNQKNYVKIISGQVTEELLYEGKSKVCADIMKASDACQFCEHPACSDSSGFDICGMLRRAACGNLYGASVIAKRVSELNQETMKQIENSCVLNEEHLTVKIQDIVSKLSTIKIDVS